MANESFELEKELPENALIFDASAIGKIQNRYCPFCDCDRDTVFQGFVAELGDIPRFQCQTCLRTWESIFN